MEVKNIPWSHIILHGGLTAFAYQVHCDLNCLTDYLENQTCKARDQFYDAFNLYLVPRVEYANAVRWQTD